MNVISTFQVNDHLTTEQWNTLHDDLEALYYSNQFVEDEVEVEQWKVFMRGMYCMLQEADPENDAWCVALLKCFLFFTGISKTQTRRLIQYGMLELIRQNLGKPRSRWSLKAQEYWIALLYNLIIMDPAYAIVIQQSDILFLLIDIGMTEQRPLILKTVLETFDAFFVDGNIDVFQESSSKAILPVLFHALYSPYMDIVDEACCVIQRHIRRRRCMQEILSNGIARRLIELLTSSDVFATFRLNKMNTNIAYDILKIYEQSDETRTALISCGLLIVPFASCLRDTTQYYKLTYVYELMVHLCRDHQRRISVEERRILLDHFCSFSHPPVFSYNGCFKDVVRLLGHCASDMDADDFLFLQQHDGYQHIYRMLTEGYSSDSYWDGALNMLQSCLNVSSTFCAYNHLAAFLARPDRLSELLRKKNCLNTFGKFGYADQLFAIIQETLMPLCTEQEDDDADVPLYGADQCCICRDSLAEVACMPCKHALYCDGCLTQWLFKEDGTEQRCPTCRAIVSYTIELKHKKRRFI